MTCGGKKNRLLALAMLRFFGHKAHPEEDMGLRSCEEITACCLSCYLLSGAIEVQISGPPTRHKMLSPTMYNSDCGKMRAHRLEPSVIISFGWNFSMFLVVRIEFARTSFQ